MRRVILLCILVCVVALAGGCARADFNQPADLAQVEQAWAAHGLQICDQNAVSWNSVPGVVEGTRFDLNLGCANHTQSNPGARAWIVAFSDLASRENAMRHKDGTWRAPGPALSWTLGPLVIVVDGPQNPDVITAVQASMKDLGAK